MQCSLERELHFRRAAARTVADACARGFLARLDAGLLEITLVAQSLDDALLVEDLLQALERAFNGLVLFQLELYCHLPFSPPWCSRPFGRRKRRIVYQKNMGYFKHKVHKKLYSLYEAITCF